ncbi:hypothetical protein ACG04R_25410 [Roseateles sp. BYS78W]|uniref:Uncharacterized protein n=1 Tax=Pelomonas candidula TaxID=3299025 RepID=A0ABW7HJE6_9BURK
MSDDGSLDIGELGDAKPLTPDDVQRPLAKPGDVLPLRRTWS